MRSLRPGQLPLDLAHRDALGRDDLIEGASNRAAIAMVESWPHWASAIGLIVGPIGSGKSHIAAVWRDISGAAVLDAAAIGAEAIETAHERCILIDGVAPGRLDERGLFHLVNTIRASGRHLLLTAREAPSAWGVVLPDLLSRLRSAAIVPIEAPDDDLLARVITKLFADRQVDVDPQVVLYLMRHMERSLGAANAIVTALDRMALARKTRITRALAAEVIDEKG